MLSWAVLLLYCSLQLVFASSEDSSDTEETTTAAPEEGGSKAWIWVVAAVIVVIVIIGIVFLVLWKKGYIQKWFCKKKELKELRKVAPMPEKKTTKSVAQIKKGTKGSMTKGSTTRSAVASGSSSKTGKAVGAKKKAVKGQKKQKKMVGKKESGSTTNTATETQKESSTLEKVTKSVTPVQNEQVKHVNPSKESVMEEVILNVGGRWTVVNEIGSDISFEISSVDSV